MRSFAAPFIVQKDADYARPFLIADVQLAGPTLRIASRTPLWDGSPVPIDGNDYLGVVASWGEIAAPLEGFGEAFATPSTEIEILNDHVFAGGFAFWQFLVNPNYVAARQTDVKIYWCFQNPDTGVIEKELALRGPVVDKSFDWLSSKIKVTSRAEAILNKDVLKSISVSDAPNNNALRVLPLAINAANKLPMWIYSADRSKFVIGEDVRARGTSYTLGPVYYRGADVIEDETSAENFPPEISIG